ncbi:hypothetical protein PC120_g15465 [Phytophthora cactorum]|nr:hypothetical protein PC120_g15465 [Phytophthora cactorum]
MGETELGQVAPVDTCKKEATSIFCKKRSLRRRLVDSRWLFNNIHVGEVLIDCRSSEQCHTNTVRGAINVPPPEDDNDSNCDEYVANLGISTTKRSLRDLLLFAGEEDVANPESWLHKLEQFLIDEGRAASIKVLCEGFTQFHKRYPFYTSLGIVDDGVLHSGEHQVSYPNEIVDKFLFLGNMWQAQCKQVIQDLGITHVVNATRKVANVFENDGVKYINAKLDDKPDENITQFFNSTYEFIAQAQRSTTADRKPCRVLVHCTHGISRSATLVIVYIMRAYHWSLAQAFNFVRSGRGVVVPNEGFLRALLREERRLFHNKCSVTADELDLLTSGCLPSQPARLQRRTSPSLELAAEPSKDASPSNAFAYRSGKEGSQRMPEAPSSATNTSYPIASRPALTTVPGERQQLGSGMSVGDESNGSGSSNKSAAADVPKDDAAVDAACPTEESEPVPPARKRLVRRGEVNCRWLYNQVQASRGMILIDTRSREEYEEDSIPSAISIPPMRGCRTLEDVESELLEEQRYLFSSKKRKLRDVVLFGDAVKKSSADDANDSKTCSWLRKLERLIIEDGLVTSVKLLCDGFLTFKYRYPFYTTSALLDEISGQLTRTKSGTHNLNYPNEILEGFLFLGNMWHAQSKQVVSHLGITHVVNASLDVGNTFESDGVKYLNVTIKDRPEADISSYFDAAYRFIESAKRTQHGRVLVHCTQGISRSATLVIMYLMRANNWSLVTAVNFAMASRGVVYPNQGFVKSLMMEEFRLYKGNSITPDEVDTMLQNLIPDRPVPLQVHSNRTENCSRCRKMFSLLEWKHKCSYCRKAFCSKCTNTRLANPEREKSAASNGAIDEQRPRRVCQVCVSRLWQINLPRSRKGLQPRMQRCKHLNVNSLSTFGRTVCISYFEGTEPQVIMDVLKIRFGVKENQIIDISRDDGEPIRTVEEIVGLPDEAEVFVSVGKAGNIQECSQRVTKQFNGSSTSRYTNSNHRQPFTRHHHHERTRQQFRRELQSPRDRFFRERSSSEGVVDTLQQIETSGRPPDAPRTRSFQMETCNVEASTVAPPVEDPEVAERKFRELWKLSFPSMGLIERAALLKIKRPEILMDVMLGMSSLSCGALTLQEFSQRLIELGYADSDRQAVISLLDTARRTTGRVIG